LADGRVRHMFPIVGIHESRHFYVSPTNRQGGWHSGTPVWRVQVTINNGRWHAGVPIFGHPAPEMITDSPAVLNRIKHLTSEAQLP
jgi:hypothetical protein